MFRIGEFAQIAQVSSRQLRHYDQLGLLRPGHTNPQTGYRYYGIRQLPRLNSILALKELGLSLEQIGPLLEDKDISRTARHAHHEASASRAVVAREEARLTHRSRIAQIDRQGRIEGYDVVEKSVPATPSPAADPSKAWTKSSHDPRHRRGRPQQIRPTLRQVDRRGAHDDVERRSRPRIGFSLTRQSNASVRISRLRAARQRASGGANDGHHRAARDQCRKPFILRGHRHWIELTTTRSRDRAAKSFSSRSPSRRASRALVEIQFPVRHAA